MKKLMIAAAASALVGGAFAIESANIVGYQHNETTNGFRMVSGCGFGAIGGQRGFWISSITPMDYHNNSDMYALGGTTGQFNIQMLSSEGKVAGIYDWIETCSGYSSEGWDGDQHWNNPQGQAIIPGSANDTFIPASSGLYFNAPATDMDDDPTKPYYPISFAGQVDTNDLQYTFLQNGGFQCVGNPFPVAIKLSSLIPTGYHNNADMYALGGTTGQFNIQLLSNEGKVSGIYDWIETCSGYDPSGWDDDGHWNAPNGKEIVAGDENDLIIKPGMGLYFNSPEHMGDDGNPYTITFKYPMAK